MTALARRSFITGLGALFIAAPAVARASSLDVVRGALLSPSEVLFYPIKAVDYEADPSRFLLIHGFDQYGAPAVRRAAWNDAKGWFEYEATPWNAA